MTRRMLSDAAAILLLPFWLIYIGCLFVRYHEAFNAE